MDNVFDIEKLKRELEQLRDMNPNDAIEVLKGYHGMYRNRLHEITSELKNISDLSPATFRLTGTATIIANSDFLSKQEDEKLNHLYIEGNKDELAKLFINIFKQCPDVFEKTMALAGYVKA